MFTQKKVGPKVWTTDEFIRTYLQADPAALKSETLKKIEDRVKRFNVLIPDLQAEIIEIDEEDLQELLGNVNRTLERAKKYPNVYKKHGAIIGDETFLEEELKHVEHVAVTYPLVFETLDAEEIIDDYQDEAKLKALNERFKKDMQEDLDQRLEAIKEPSKETPAKEAEAAEGAQPEADSPPVRRRFGCC